MGFLHFDDPTGDVHIKYGYVTGDDYYVLKVASGFYNNPDLGLPASDGGVDLDTITLPLLRKYSDQITLLTEEQIAGAIRILFEHHRLVVEGSGALSVGGFLKLKDSFKGKKVVLAICGRNIDLDLFKQII